MYRGYFFKLFNGLKLALFLCVLISFSNLYSAPEKVATKTAAAKAAPASAIGAKPAAKAPAKAAAKPAAPKAVAKAAAKPTGPISLKAPITAGFQNVVSPDSKTIMNPDKTKSIASAKSFSEQLEELEKGKAPDKKKKAVKMRKQIIDGKVCVWGRSAEDAEMYASEAIRKFVGKKAMFKVKDSLFIADSPKYICMVRFNYSDEIPETWCLETEMVTGFGKTRERAYVESVQQGQECPKVGRLEARKQLGEKFHRNGNYSLRLSFCHYRKRNLL